ncbi:hypothetical protein AUK22_08385 [bacterium CG2_30_54_10]|nr:MAG: hypothetical protein AUK22_08385 [bacterium CG2_30_54_10]
MPLLFEQIPKFNASLYKAVIQMNANEAHRPEVSKGGHVRVTRMALRCISARHANAAFINYTVFERLFHGCSCRRVAWLLLACGLLFHTGCGGGGGGGGSGAGVDPIEVEVRAALDSFTSAVSAENVAEAKALLSPNLKYFSTGSTAPDGLDQFMTRLTAFFRNAASISLELQGLGVSSNGETVAATRGTLICHYRDASGAEHLLQEEVEINLERNFQWQITSLSRFNQAMMTFPP